MKRIPTTSAHIVTDLCLALCLLASLVTALPARAACSSYTECLIPPGSGTQPCHDETNNLITKVCQNKLSSGEGPTINKIYSTNSGTKVAPSMPCVFFKSVIYVESSWTMFCANCGSVGTTIIPTSCGFGYAQITWGMKANHGHINVSFDREKVANSPIYNLATGFQNMTDNWNMKPYFDGRNPEIIEHWYFAAWRYNNYAWVNNPNNPKYDANRVPLNCSGSGSASKYPYPERVWGFMKCPVTKSGSPLWPSVDITYPDPSIFCNTADCTPSTSSPYTFRLPHHKDPCQKGQSGAPYDSTSDTDGDGSLDYLDCAPNDARVKPGATEACDGVDNDCDGSTDEGATCGTGYSCKNGGCVADVVPEPEPEPEPEPDPEPVDAGLPPTPTDASTPTPADDAGSGDDEGDAGEPSVLVECATHTDCPDDHTCVRGMCEPDLEFEPLPDDGDSGGDGHHLDPSQVLILKSGCGCLSTDAAPALPLLFLAFLLLLRRRSSRDA